MNEMYEDFTNTIISVTDKFAPQKVKKCIPKPVPYMNKSLKQAVYKKQMLFNNGSLTLAMGKCLWFSVKIKVCQSPLSFT